MRRTIFPREGYGGEISAFAANGRGASEDFRLGEVRCALVEGREGYDGF